MATPASGAIIAVYRDEDLTTRLLALAPTLNLDPVKVEAAKMKLSSAPVDEDGNTIASVYEYRVSQEPKYRPGEDPAAVTDAHLIHALKATFPEVSVPSEG